ncbi:hypothetical protein IEE94_14315 [Yimella sp. cx-573]|nr:hypothetical protein [Yimella sp. cx-573]
MKRALSGLAVAALCGSMLTGCFDEKPCNSGEYPVTGTGTATGGKTCVPDGSPAPSGFDTYPPGKTPTTVP